MPAFPRTLKPARVTAFEVPTGLVSLGQTGKAQLRTTAQVGRVWRESWPPLRAGKVDVEAFLAFVEDAYHQQVIFDIDHLLTPGSGKAPNGAGGGTSLVAGASQTGSSLATDGWSASVTNVVRAGDVIRIAGLNLLYRITADANSDGLGAATLSINPPIPAGSSPADNAAITRSGCLLRAYIAERPNIPAAGAGELLAGLSLTFREAP